MANKRKFSTGNLAFLDIMSCGFGAVILVFLIIKHDVNTQIESQDQQLMAEVSLLETEVLDGEKSLAELKNSLALLDQELVETTGLARRVNDDAAAIAQMIVKLELAGNDQQILKLKQQVITLNKTNKSLEEQQRQGNDARRFNGQGERQYLTGLKLGGEHILILLDTSASMLDQSIVNVIRRRNMADETKKHAAKWQRAIKAIEWLLAKFPLQSQFQLYSFNGETNTVTNAPIDRWLNISDQQQLQQAIGNLHQIIPSGGTNLEAAFRQVSQLHPLPDNIILLTDSLPTQGGLNISGNTISGKDRERLFERAVNTLPQGIPVNILLWPMEGDPIAASAFWKLAQYSSGSFMSPSRDWP